MSSGERGMTWGHHTRTDGCWVKPPWWRGVWHRWFVIHTWICCVTARSRELGFPLHHAWHQALQSTYPQYTYRTVRPHACSRLHLIRPPKRLQRRPWQSKYHSFNLHFEMVKQQFREFWAPEGNNAFSRQTSDTLSPLLVANSIPGHPSQTHAHTICYFWLLLCQHQKQANTAPFGDVCCPSEVQILVKILTGVKPQNGRDY